MTAPLQSSPIGEFVEVSGVDHRSSEAYTHHAFVPAPLPDEVGLAPETWTQLTKAQAAIARLDGAVSELPDPMLLVRPLVRREAVSTSALEGTHTGFGELLGAEASRETQSGDVLEVLNYVEATEHGIARLAEIPVCVRLVDEAHAILLRGVRGDSYATGSVRQTQNWIGHPGCRIQEAALVPPPADRLVALLSDWERWIHREDLPILLRAAVGHYQFETIHPYSDGNGRLGRLLAVLQLIEAGLMRHHLMTISGFFERDKAAYIGHLQRVRETGEFDPWVRYFCRGLEGAATQSLERIRKAQTLTREVIAHLRSSGVRGTAIQVAEDLVGYPVLTVPEVEQRYGVAYQTANTVVTRLVEAGILTQVSGGNYGRVFAALPLMRVFE